MTTQTNNFPHPKRLADFSRQVPKLFLFAAAFFLLLTGCMSTPKPKPYGEESQLSLPSPRQQIWAVAPTINLSGITEVDPLLNSDLVFSQLQQVHGLTVIPVNRVVQVFLALKIDQVQSEKQAYAVCDLLGCDALVVPTITAYDPYDPPKVAASLQLIAKPGTFQSTPTLDIHALERSAAQPAADTTDPIPSAKDLIQEVGMYDAADGSVREKALAYAAGRTDPNTPIGPDEIFISMDNYCGFVYHDLIAKLLADLTPGHAKS